MRPKGFFITGTDTGAGKTHVSLRLMRVLQGEGLTVVGMKPVASGAAWNGERWVNEDALALCKACSMTVEYEWVNPYAFELPVAPHIAAKLTGTTVEFSRLRDAYERLAARADCVVVEGVGGWKVPLNADEDVADLAGAFDLPVLLVVGLRLGCINHALLTYESMVRSGVNIAGWIANHLEPDLLRAEDVVETLCVELGAKPLGIQPFRSGSLELAGSREEWNHTEILRMSRP